MAECVDERRRNADCRQQRLILPCGHPQERRIAACQGVLGEQRHRADGVEQGIVVRGIGSAPGAYPAHCQVGRAAHASIGDDHGDGCANRQRAYLRRLCCAICECSTATKRNRLIVGNHRVVDPAGGSMQALFATEHQRGYCGRCQRLPKPGGAGADECGCHGRTATHPAGNGDVGLDGDDHVGWVQIPRTQNVAQQFEQRIAVDPQPCAPLDIGHVQLTARLRLASGNVHRDADVGQGHGQSGAQVDDGVFAGDDELGRGVGFDGTHGGPQ